MNVKPGIGKVHPSESHVTAGGPPFVADGRICTVPHLLWMIVSTLMSRVITCLFCSTYEQQTRYLVPKVWYRPLCMSMRVIRNMTGRRGSGSDRNATLWTDIYELLS